MLFYISPKLYPFTKEEKMLVEFSIIPVGSGSSIGDRLAEVLKIVDASGIPLQS